MADDMVQTINNYQLGGGSMQQLFNWSITFMVRSGFNLSCCNIMIYAIYSPVLGGYLV